MNTRAEENQIARINRQLAKNYEKVCTSRSWRMESNVGKHYKLDIYRNVVIETHVNLDNLETELRSAA